jgi:hypothetical protein
MHCIRECSTCPEGIYPKTRYWPSPSRLMVSGPFTILGVALLKNLFLGIVVFNMEHYCEARVGSSKAGPHDRYFGEDRAAPSNPDIQ